MFLNDFGHDIIEKAANVLLYLVQFFSLKVSGDLSHDNEKFEFEASLYKRTITFKVEFKEALVLQAIKNLFTFKLNTWAEEVTKGAVNVLNNYES